MKNKKNTIMLIMVITISMILLSWNKSYSYKMDDNEPEETEIERKEFGIYLQEDGTTYKETDTFPTQGYLLNTTKTECHEYGNNTEISGAVTQSLTNGVIDGSIIVTSQKSMYCKIYFDKDEKPTVSSFNITGKTSNNEDLNNGFTNQTSNLPITIDYTDTESDVVQYCINETNNSDSCSWKQLNGKSGNYTLTNTNDGSKTIYAYIKDKANNISSTTSISTANITVDRTKPVVNTLTLIGTSANSFTATSGYTHTTMVNYTSTITETNLGSYCVGENSCNSNSPLSTTLISGQVIIGSQETSHNVVINVKDKAGNTGSANSTITLDLYNPTISLTQGVVTETSITVTVDANDVHGIVGVTCTAVGNNETKTGIYTNNACLFDGLKDGTTYSITGVATDNSGRKTTSTAIDVTTDKSLTAGQKKAKEVLGVAPKGISDKLLGDMYRFVGTKDAVDNWICFGYSEANATDCNSPSSDSMYRIIGITEDGKLKLINNVPAPWTKSTSWDNLEDDTYHSWNESSLASSVKGVLSNRLNLKIPNSSKTWFEMIVDENWPTGELVDSSIWSWPKTASASDIYSLEMNVRRITLNYGILSLSDYYFSYAVDGVDSAKTSCGYEAECSNSWLHLTQNGVGLYYDTQVEWVIDALDTTAYVIRADGTIDAELKYHSGVARPVFYISAENVKVRGGIGSMSEPFIVVSKG